MAQAQTQTKSLPRTGDTFRCDQCGMELALTKDCKCEEGEPHFECCGKPLTAVKK
jgi:hypothetical protein